jgi:2-keto-3-deoxy-L-fuconate dehydrogenase
MRLRDKTVVVTAAGQGIGRASALACRDEGARVIATDIDGALLEGLEGVETAVLDVTRPDAVEAIAARVGPLDGLFNCAGVVHNGTLLDIKDEDWAFAFDLNVTAMMRVPPRSSTWPPWRPP